MKLSTINTGFFKLDGGAMFGVVPQKMWKKLNPPDENNMCTWAMRCLLIETDHRKILVDTGLGNKQGEKFRSHFEPFGKDSLLGSLAQKGLKPEDITDVFLTHLHFDHVGGAVSFDEDNNYIPTFPNATYWSNKRHYDWALDPNPRERASFLKENFVPLLEQHRLQFIPDKEGREWINGIRIHFVHGHTEAMMNLHIETKKGTIVYAADLFPSSYHIGLPYVMSYDIRPLVTLKEKKQLLELAVKNNYIFFFEHDPKTECAYIHKNERGRFSIKETFSLAELFS